MGLFSSSLHTPFSEMQPLVVDSKDAYVDSAVTIARSGSGSESRKWIDAAVQREASLRLHEFICRNTGIDPHSIVGPIGVRGAGPGDMLAIHFQRLEPVDWGASFVNHGDLGTGTLRARAVLPNQAGLFSPGLFARVRVTGTAQYMAVLIPDEAIGTDQTNKYVFAVGEDGTVSRKGIVPGPLFNGLRVVREGLTGDEWVITRGLQRARPGQKVTPKRETLTVSEAPAGGLAQKKRE
jgi:hypothetical protein